MSNVSLAPAVRSSKPFRILSNVQRLPESLPGGERLRHDFLPIGSRLFWNSWRAHVRSLFRDAIILHLPGKELFLLCLLRLLLPWSRARLIVVEAILPKPGTGRWARLSAWFKGLLLRRVDLFLLYQKDIQGLTVGYGIPADKCQYIPFKVNSREVIASIDSPPGTYVFTGGQSRRDYDTFIEAMRGLPYPGVIATPPEQVTSYHETYFDKSKLPSNVRVKHDATPGRRFIEAIAQARVVVMPIRAEAIGSAGVGVYLMAMALRKCVIITDSPATRGILEHEENAILVPPEDPQALREAIRNAWEDDSYRCGIAERGFEYAQSLGGEEELRHNIAERTAAFLRSVAC